MNATVTSHTTVIHSLLHRREAGLTRDYDDVRWAAAMGKYTQVLFDISTLYEKD